MLGPQGCADGATLQYDSKCLPRCLEARAAFALLAHRHEVEVFSATVRNTIVQSQDWLDRYITSPHAFTRLGLEN